MNGLSHIDIDLKGPALTLAEAIVALLKERKVLTSTFRIGEPRSDEADAWFTVYWEGTDASPFFSMDHCVPAGKWCGSAEDYEPWETMLALCIEYGAHPMQSWGASPVWGDNKGASQ